MQAIYKLPLIGHPVYVCIRLSLMGHVVHVCVLDCQSWDTRYMCVY